MTDLRNIISDMVRQQAIGMDVHAVTAVNGDGTVTLGSAGVAVTNVPCSSAYPIRAIGDKVLVLKSGPAWTVFAKAETTASDGNVTIQNLYDAIDNLHAQILAEIPQSISLKFGTGASPSDYADITSVSVKDLGNGNFSLYLRGASGTASSRGTSATAGKSIGASAYASWSNLDGSKDSSRVRQGGNDAWIGAWFYGTKISDACAGKNVATMTLALKRTTDGRNPAPVRAYLHDGMNATTKPNLLDGPQTPFSMAISTSATFVLPSTWVARLADPNDSARGIAVYSPELSEYIPYSTSSGTVAVTFS